MIGTIALLASWLMLFTQQTSNNYSEEFRLKPNTAQLSQAFSEDAWIVLIQVSRLGADDQSKRSSDERARAEMTRLMSEPETDGEWLFCFYLRNYSIAKLIADAIPDANRPLFIKDLNTCRSALVAANRARVMTAVIPACELVRNRPIP